MNRVRLASSIARLDGRLRLPELLALPALGFFVLAQAAFGRGLAADLDITGDTMLSASADYAGGRVHEGAVLTLDPIRAVTVVFTENLIVDGTLVSRPAPGVRHTIRFEGVDEAAYVGGGMAPIDSDVGLWVVGAGRLELAGSAKTSWTRLAGSAGAGDRSLAFAEPPAGWEAGDSIVVAPTNPPTKRDFDVQFDTSKLGGVHDFTVDLVDALAFGHPKVGGRWTAEVMNLSRNVVIEGTPTGRAHIWISSTSPQMLSNVELRYLGPAKASDPDASVLGRYPLHFHHAHDGSRGSMVEGWSSTIPATGRSWLMPATA